MADPPGSTEESVAPPGHPAPSDSARNISAPAGTWERIKKHKILQWGLGYLGGAIAIAHAQELMAEAFDWPHLIGRILMSLLVLGFPLVLTLAWYHGHKGLRRVGTGEMYIISLLMLIAAGLLVVFVRTPAEGVGAEAASHAAHVSNSNSKGGTSDASVAVLPFRDMSSAKDQEYFADGITEEILNSLAGLHDLKVTGRTSSFAFKGKDVDLRTIGETLGVGNILEGSVRKDGGQLRITVQLNNAVTGYHLWSKSYDRPLEGIFAIQEDIARSVAQALEVSLGVGDLGHQPGMTRNVEAYDAYLAGLADIVINPDILSSGIAKLEQATSLDPSFVVAWQALWNSYSFASVIGVPGNSPVGWAAKADAVIGHIKGNGDYGDGLAAGLLGDRSMNTWNFVEAEKQFATHRLLWKKLGVAEVPGTVELALVVTGRFKDAIDNLEREKTIDPLNAFLALLLSKAYADAGNLHAAIAEEARGLQMGNGTVGLQQSAYLVALALRDRTLIDKRIAISEIAEGDPQGLAAAMKERLNRPEAALIELRRRAAITTDQIQLSTIALWMAYYGAPDAAVEIYRTHTDLFRSSRRSTMLFDIWHPLMRDARKLSAFKDLVRSMGLVDYWREFGWGDLCQPVGTNDFACH